MLTSTETDARPMFGPAGDWADLPRFTPPGRPGPDQSADGRCVWLNDTQVDLTGDQRVWLTRTITEAVTTDGLTGVAQVDVDFDPSYERVVFHHVYILRDGQLRSYDARKALQVFQRERDLERARFDGRLTAHFVIPDIRVGDIVDICWSQIGENPILRGAFAAEWVLEWGCWVGETRVRLTAPRDRPLAVRAYGRAPPAQERVLPGGALERVWRTQATPGVRGEAAVPNWARRLSSVACGDMITWAQVADRFRPLYRFPETLPPELEAEVQAIAAAEPTPAGRAMAALRLVQGGLRYQSVTMGTGGFAPNPLDRIWASRSGDCKDASLLLTGVLRRLGVEAAPALVNTFVGRSLADEPPQLTAFNHCIVRARIDGVSYWLDGTVFPQGGRLETLHQMRSDWALPLVEDATLESMGKEPLEHISDVVEEVVFGPEPDSPAQLTVRTTDRSWRADWMRRRIAAGVSVMEEEFREFYARRHGAATSTAPLEIVDDLAENRIVITERYEIARPWDRRDPKLVRFDTVDDLWAPNLPGLGADNRRYPIELGLPRRLTHEIILRTGQPLTIDAWDETFSAVGITLTSKHAGIDARTGAFSLAKTLTVTREDLEPGEAAALFSLREKAHPYAGLAVTLSLQDGRFRPGGADQGPFAAPLYVSENRKSSSGTPSGLAWGGIAAGFFLVVILMRACAMQASEPYVGDRDLPTVQLPAPVATAPEPEVVQVRPISPADRRVVDGQEQIRLPGGEWVTVARPVTAPPPVEAAPPIAHEGSVMTSN